MSADDFTDLSLPFGQTGDGRLISVAEAERGAACNCVCPQCEKPIIARKGDINRHHFAHTATACGPGALETSLHKMAKQIILDAGKIWLPECVALYPPHGAGHYTVRRRVSGGGWIEGNIIAEKQVGAVRPDVLLIAASGHQLGIEIYVTHMVSAEKREKLKALNLACVEVDLSTYPRDCDVDRLTNFVLRGAARMWLYHPKYADYLDGAKREFEAAQEIREEEARARENHEWRMRLMQEDREREREKQLRLKREEARQRMLDPATKPSGLGAAFMRPSYWFGVDAFPTPGAFCSTCNGRVFRRAFNGWACASCVPPNVTQIGMVA